MTVESADEFYCIMGVLTREILEFGLMDTNIFLKVRMYILLHVLVYIFVKYKFILY